jgi:hypothetical protein
MSEPFGSRHCRGRFNGAGRECGDQNRSRLQAQNFAEHDGDHNATPKANLGL